MTNNILQMYTSIICEKNIQQIILQKLLQKIHDKRCVNVKLIYNIFICVKML